MEKFPGILGRKKGMTQVFSPEGEAIDVTVIEAGPCYITQIKTEETDGYKAVQIGYEEAKKLNKPEEGHLKKIGKKLRHLKEFRVNDVEGLSLGDRIDVSIFEEGELVDVTGRSKGRGFAGVVKRWDFAGGPKTHGQSDRHRAPGSIGASTDPGRVLPGKKMAGHYGDEKITVQNLKVVRIIPEKNIIMVKGSVPGPRNGLVVIKRAKKGKR